MGRSDCGAVTAPPRATHSAPFKADQLAHPSDREQTALRPLDRPGITATRKVDGIIPQLPKPFIGVWFVVVR